MSDSAHGTATIQLKGRHNLAQLFTTEGALATLLGIDEPGATHGCGWVPTIQQGHALTFGATRSGKGVSAIIPALITYQGSCVVIDPKGENAWATAERRRQIGQRVVILDPWGEVNRRYGGKVGVTEQVTSFNPLSALDPESEDFADDVSAIAEALVIPGGNDPHWSESARELIKGLIAAVVENNPGKASLREVRKLLSFRNEALSAYLEMVKQKAPNSLGAMLLDRFTTDSTEIGSVRSVAQTQTAFLDSKTLLRGMETDSPPFNLNELVTGKVTVFLVLPLDKLRTHGRWLRLLLTLTIREVARAATPPDVPVMFLMDEMGTVGRLDVVEQAFGLMAGIGIRLWAFLQDLNQLKRDYPHSWETFISNAAIIQVLNARDITTSQYFSNYLGNMTITNTSVETAEKRSAAIKKGMPKELAENIGGMNDQSFGRPVMFPEEIREMHTDKMILIYVGDGNYLINRNRYYNEPRWDGLYRRLPAHDKQAAPPAAEPEAAKAKGWGWGKR